MARDVHVEMAGRVRPVQNWIEGYGSNPRGAAFVPSPPEEAAALLSDLLDFCSEERLSPLVDDVRVEALGRASVP